MKLTTKLGIVCILLGTACGTDLNHRSTGENPRSNDQVKEDKTTADPEHDDSGSESKKDRRSTNEHVTPPQEDLEALLQERMRQADQPGFSLAGFDVDGLPLEDLPFDVSLDDIQGLDQLAGLGDILGGLEGLELGELDLDNFDIEMITGMIGDMASFEEILVAIAAVNGGDLPVDFDIDQIGDLLGGIGAGDIPVADLLPADGNFGGGGLADLINIDQIQDVIGGISGGGELGNLEDLGDLLGGDGLPDLAGILDLGDGLDLEQIIDQFSASAVMVDRNYTGQTRTGLMTFLKAAYGQKLKGQN